MHFYNENKLFTYLYFLAVLATLIAVYKLGFGESAQQISSAPERLRDITFHIWDNYPVYKHGFLVFLSPDQFARNIAYSNHSTAYLFYMYTLYKIEMFIPSFQMRVVGALFNMISLAGAMFYIISCVTEKRIALMKSLLTLLAVIFMISMPGFWISAASFNVDNSFPLIFMLLLLISFFIWQDKGNGKRVWISITLFALFSPLSAVLLGLALYLYSLQRDGLDKNLFKLATSAAFMGCIFYFQAPVVSEILGFTSSNSGWLFRAGLDGDTTYFFNAFMSVVSPYYPRPLHIIAIPILLLLAQAVYFRTVARKEKLEGGKSRGAQFTSSTGIFYYLIFSQYIFTWLLWPQAIAIHPYIYDYLFLAPVSVLIILNFLVFPTNCNYSRLWVLALLFFISFNFQQIAQSKCNGCVYPAWNINK
jgi:hypothetical protein